MKTKLVLWGSNAQDERVLIAMELRAADNKVDIWTFPESIATEDFSQLLMQNWRNGETVAFPDGYTHLERELTVSDSLLPDDIKTDRGDLIQRAQTEWHFVVLSSKLNEVYRSELVELEEKVNQMTEYSAEMWNNLKEFWDKVQEQVRERNLFRDHADSLRDNINVLFSKLKDLRSEMDNVFHRQSQEVHDQFMEALNEIDSKLNISNRLPALFEELKQMQRSFRDVKLTREHSASVWQRLDNAFKQVKEKRFGESAVNDNSAGERLERRFEGLIQAIQKMQQSIDRDREDLDFQNKKIATTDGQLEAQIRQAKIKMIESRIESKEEKLHEMLQTKQELEDKMESQKEKDRKRQEKDRMEAAKEAAKKVAQDKIAEEIKSRKEDVKPEAVHTPVTEEKPVEEAKPVAEKPAKEKKKPAAEKTATEPAADAEVSDAAETTATITEVTEAIQKDETEG